ncbi:MAG: Eco57I restriction-modification methylase domain-containing protein, partial [Chloroflexota bacterium]
LMATTTAAFPTVRSEGGLLPPDLLTRIVAGDPDLAGLTPEDYGLPAKMRLGEATSRAWARARAYWTGFQAAREGLSERETGISETREMWVLPLLHELGYGRPEYRPAAEEVEGKRYAISHQAGEVPIHVVSFRQDLDHAVVAERTGRTRQGAHAMVQEYLNRGGRLYGLVTNGLQLRLLRANLSLTRLSYVEFDLAEMMAGGVYADFVLLYLTLHRSRLPREGATAEACWLEQWRDKAETQGTRALGELKGGVERAIAALGSGFLAHPANDELRGNLKAGNFAVADYYRELLRLIYRFLFLFVAEERDLLQPPTATAESRRRYRDHYAAGRLRELSARYLTDERHDDLWQGMLVTFDLLAGRRNGLEIPPLAGGLFGGESLKHLERCRLSNAALLAAVRHLSFVRVNRRLRRVNYRDMDTEELGGVYESLLERQPHLAVDGAHFELVGSGQRKQTGSYYTPSSLVTELVHSALDPVIADRLQGVKDPVGRERALLGIAVCDSACGSGHFLLAAARRLAGHLAQARAGDDEPTPVQLRQALRDAIRNCIYGVDLNPLAVDLCQLGLWLEGHSPGLPLSFLDHRIRCGNSLIGATPELIEDGIPDDAYNPVTGDVRAVASAFKKRNRQEAKGKQLSFGAGEWREHEAELAKHFAALGLLPEGTVAEVQAKRRQWETLRQGQDWWRDLTTAHLWTTAFFAPLVKADDPRVPTTGTLLAYRLTGRGHGEMVGLAYELAAEHRFFHWHLEFPEVFARGGFDCVLGNPPWERIKLQEEEFFADRDPVIAAAANKAARQKLIDALPKTDPALARAFAAAKRDAEGQSKFVRASGRFNLTAVGDVNLFALFAGQNRALLNGQARAGMIVPTGIATDDTTKAFFADLAEHGSLATLFDFENRDAVFPSVHRSYKFCLLTMAGGRVPSGDFAFFLHRTDELHDDRRRFRLSPEDFALLNPNTRTCPVFRTKEDAELTKAIYRRVPVLVNERTGENPWGVQFLAMFHMSNDSHLFRTAEQLAQEGWQQVGNTWERGGRRYLPLYEAKMFHQFNHRWATYDGSDFRDVAPAELADPSFVAQPRYWVPEHEVAPKVAQVPALVMMNRYTEEGSKRSLAMWLAGYRLNHGDEDGAAKIMSSLYLWDSPEATLTGALQAQAMERRYPLTQNALAHIAVASRNHGEYKLAVKCIIDDYQLQWLLSFRDIARATDERTAIFSALPRVGVGHNAPIAFVGCGQTLQVCFLANMCAMPFDYVVRQKIGGTHLTYTYVKQLPVIPPSAYSQSDLEFVTPRVLELTYTARDLQPFARDCGYDGPPFKWDEERRAQLRAELDAYYASLYGLTRDELRYILDPADVYGPDFPGETFRVLKEKEIRQHGEYRTRRLVLEAWDRLGLAPRNRDGRYSAEPAGGTTGKGSPPPAAERRPAARPRAADAGWQNPRPTLPGLEPLQAGFGDMEGEEGE